MALRLGGSGQLDRAEVELTRVPLLLPMIPTPTPVEPLVRIVYPSVADGP